MTNRKILTGAGRVAALLLALCLLAACGGGEAEAPVSSLAAPSSRPAAPESAAPESEAQSAPESSAIDIPDADGAFTVEMPAPSLADNRIGEAAVRDLGICLPPGYQDSGESYPVLYFLTGYTEDYAWRSGVFYDAMAGLYAQGAVRDMIIVVVNGANRFGGGWYANSPVSGNWEDFVAEDVVGFIDANLRTVPGPEGRCLVGHSMGGAGALHIAMHRPGLFGSVYAMSPAITPEDGLDMFGPQFDMLEVLVNEYSGMEDKNEAAQRWLGDLENLDTAYWWGLSYATAFGYAEQALPPYIALPEKGADGAFARDEVWQRYDAGVGAWADKIAWYHENLARLSGLAIDYGTQDGFAFIPPGCEELGALLDQYGVPHVLESYEGGHNDQIEARIVSHVIPFFEAQLAA